MTDNYKILCDIGEEIKFNIGGQSKTVDFNELEKEEILNRIYRIQFNRAPIKEQLEQVLKAIDRRPEIQLRFYGNYHENLIDWSKLVDIQCLQIDLWEIENLNEVSQLSNLKKLGITKNVKSKVSLKILEPLQHLEVLYTSISKDVEIVADLKRLKFLSLNGVKHNNLSFLTELNDLEVLWLSLGSFKDFSGLSNIQNLSKLWVHQVKGFESEKINYVLQNCKELAALKLDNLKHVTNLDFVPSMHKLKYISFEGVKNLNTYSSIINSTSLETISGYDCRPKDKSLLGLTNLKNVLLGDSYTKDKIEELLASKTGQNIWIRGKSLRGGREIENPFEING